MKKLISLTFAIALCVGLFGGCAEFTEGVKQGMETALKGDIQTGAWTEDGKTFTNEWSNLKFDLPDGYRKLSDDEIKQMTGAGAELIAENSEQNQAAVDAAMSPKRMIEGQSRRRLRFAARRC